VHAPGLIDIHVNFPLEKNRAEAFPPRRVRLAELRFPGLCSPPASG